MQPAVEHLIRGSWSVVAAYWLWNWLRVKRTRSREPLLRRFVAYVLPLLLAGSMLLSGDVYGDSFLHERMLPDSPIVDWLGAGLTVAGVVVACWARWLLGRNWSLAVELKDEHELIRTGPYAVVRHPIYSGLLLGFVGTAIAIGEWRALIAIVILGASLVWKLRVEERWMSAQFGDAYAHYAARTNALVPGVF